MMRRRRYYFEDFEDRQFARDPVRARLGGVCAGIARYLEVPTFWVRLVAVVSLCIAPQVTLIAYGLAYLVLDEA